MSAQGTDDTFLAYDFDHFLSGHVSGLGTREDVIVARDYCWDVRDTMAGLMPEIIDRWSDELSVVDVWADSHCEVTALYFVMH